MTLEQISSLRKFIISQQNHWVFFGAAYFFMVVAPVNPVKPGLPMLIWFTIGCFPFMFYMVKKATDSTVWFWSVHLLAVLFAVLIPTPHGVCKIAYVGFTMLYCIYSLFFRYSKEGAEDKEIPILVSAGITFTLLLLLQFFRMYEYQRIFVNIFVVNIFLYCLAHYVQNYTNFLSVNKHSVGYMPVKQIFHAGVGGMGIFAFLMSAVLLLVANLGEMNDVVHRVLQFLGKIIKKIMSFFKRKTVGENGTGEAEVEEEVSEFVSGIMEADEVNTWPIWDVLVTVFFWIIVVYAVYKIITLLPYILRFFKAPPQVAGEEELSVTDIVESVEEVDKVPRKGIMTFWENLTPVQRIRKRFKKKILEEKDFIASKGKKDCMEWYTARECGNILDLSEMSDLYEKARYSPYECTMEDAKKMKEVCKISKK